MSTTFSTFLLHPFLLEALKTENITSPTQIQLDAIPVILEGKDVIGQSQTGTGKTFAYLLPTLHKLNADVKDLQAVVLAPTRELCMQIYQQINKLTSKSELTAIALIGGADSKRQIEKLKTKPHIIVGTPGRILELNKLKKVKLHEVKTIVVDEVDQMFDMGFTPDVEGVIKSTLKDRQLLFFSATITPDVLKRAEEWMKQPVHLQVNKTQQTAPKIAHYVMTVDLRDKIDSLRKLIHAMRPKAAIIFVNRVADIEPLVSKLTYRKLDAYGLHGETPKQEREEIMNKFNDGKIHLLVSTDLAARGLDIKGVTHIFNYDLPVDADHYVHRVGRTGRVDKSGVALSIITSKEQFIIDKFQKQLNIKIEPKTLSRGAIVDDTKPQQRPIKREPKR